jgi:hypothetical protein
MADPTEKLKAIEAAVAKRPPRKAADPTPEPVPGPPKRLRRTGKPSNKILADAQNELERFVRSHGIEQFDLFPGGEYPTPLTRLPLFPPTQRRTAQQLIANSVLDGKDWIPLESRWDGGGVYKSPNTLTVYDEDTLIGIMRLRTLGLSGAGTKMPAPAHVPPNVDGSVRVHSLCLLVSQLETVIKGYEPKRGWGGKAISERRQSIERLAATKLKFEKVKNDARYSGTVIDLINVTWIGDRSDACYYAQFHPVVSSWLESYRTFLDIDVRRQLSPTGKALYRFLASQRSNAAYSQRLDIIQQAIGSEEELPEFKRKAREQIKKMIDLEFLESGDISGTGRKTPYKLSVVFKRREL